VAMLRRGERARSRHRKALLDKPAVCEPTKGVVFE
jgi:hypothetical protein